MKKFILPLVLALISTPALAETVFLCNTTNGKQIKLVDNGDTFTYQFGKAQKPEITLSVPKSNIDYQGWSGKGSAMDYYIDIPNRSTTYSVFYSFNKHSQKVESGVIVNRHSHNPKTIFCNPKKIKVNKIEKYTSSN